jgi:aminopeptidase N
MAIPTTTAQAEPLESGFDVERYAVSLRPNLDTGSVSGRETISLRITAASLNRLTFSQNALRISGAALNGLPLDVSPRGGPIVFSLPRSMSAGERLTISFSFAGTPSRGLNTIPNGLYAGYFACDWMVCLQDAPGDKAEFSLDLFLPRGKSSLGVGRLTAKIDAGEGLTLHRWRSVLATSPYLFAFAAGNFQEVELKGLWGRLRIFDGTGQQPDLQRLFAETPAMVEFLTERAGIGLPEKQYVQLLVPGREAQETMSFSILGKDEADFQGDKPQTGWAIVHELAHQWWGNGVTSRTWKDFWLNEGFATFMVAAWKQHRFGEGAYQDELNIYRKRREQLREKGFDKPLTWSGQYPSLAYRRAVQYSKGALFLSVLREQLGDKVFWRGIKSYTRAHIGGTVDSRDFQDAMEKASGRDLDPIFNEWVYLNAIACKGRRLANPLPRQPWLEEDHPRRQLGVIAGMLD